MLERMLVTIVRRILIFLFLFIIGVYVSSFTLKQVIIYPYILVLFMLSLFSFFSPSFIYKRQRRNIFIFVIIASFLTVFGFNYIAFYILITVFLYIVFHISRTRKNITTDIRVIDQLDGFEFEEYLAELFRKKHYMCQLTKRSGDYGADLIITDRHGIKTAVQAKRYSNNVGTDALLQVVGGKSNYRTHRAMVVTNSYFTHQAIEYAQNNDVELWDRDRLINEMILVQNDLSYIKFLLAIIVKGFRLRDHLFFMLLLVSIILLLFAPSPNPGVLLQETFGLPNPVTNELTTSTKLSKAHTQLVEFTVNLAFKEDTGSEIFFLNSDDMQKLYIKDNEKIELISPTTKLALIVKSHPRVETGTIRMRESVRNKLKIEPGDKVMLEINIP